MQLTLNHSETFESRHLGPRPADVKAMLQTIGVASLDELIDKTVPPAIRLPQDLRIGKGLSEQAFLADLKTKAAKNQILRSHIGMGYYGTFTPAVVLRNIMENQFEHLRNVYKRQWYEAYRVNADEYIYKYNITKAAQMVQW
ncbi:MAG: hypothetical protein ACOVSS_04820, partial [Bacteroidia bacterium]